MMFELTDLSLIIFIAAFANIWITYISWQKRHSKGGFLFALSMLAMAFWTLAAGLDYAAIPIPLKVFFAKLESIGYNCAIALLLAFLLEYSGRESWLKNKLVRFLLVILPASNILLTITNEFHHLIWAGFSPSPIGDNVVIFEHGPGFTWVIANGYLFVAGIILILLQQSFSGTAPSRQQGRLLLFAFLIPILSNLLYLLDIFNMPGVDWSSITLSLTGLLVLIALHGARFLGIVPIARATVLDRMVDAALVLDLDGNLIDFNPAAQARLGIQEPDLWRPVKAKLAHWPEFYNILSGPPEEKVVEIAINHQEAFFEIRLTPLLDGHGRAYGQVVLARDITRRKLAEINLRASEEKFRQLMMAAPDALIGVTPNGETWFANEQAAKLLGYPIDEMIGINVEVLFPHTQPADASEPFQYTLRSGGELLARHKDGHEIPVDIRLSHIVTGAGSLVVGFSDLTQRIQAELQIRQAQEQLLAQQRQLAVVEERQRMGRELHDSVNQSIHSMVLFSETLAAMLEKNDLSRAQRLIVRLQESARQSLKETRLLLYELQILDLKTSENLVENLEMRLAMVEQRAGVQVAFTQEGSLKDCPAAWYENLYWIATEALNNALKHAQASKVQVLLRCTSEALLLEVRDNGIGFDPARPRLGGMGMGNLQARAKIIGGKLTIESEPGQGTSVRLQAEIKAD